MEVLLSIAIGLVSTLGMSLSMWTIRKLEIANADMIRAIGSLLTRKEEMSFRVGITVHFVSGAIFSIPYTIILGLIRLNSAISNMIAGGLMGFVHGFIVSFILVAFVAQAHPVKKYREPGLSVAASHIVGHLIYGILAGLLAFSWNVDYTFLLPSPETAAAGTLPVIP